MSSMTNGFLDFLDRAFVSSAPAEVAPRQPTKLRTNATTPARFVFREGLINRVGLQGALRFQSASGKAFAIILINVDGMSRINQQLGFETGDAALEAIGEFLSRFVPHTCTVAHMFSDEFAVLIPGVAASHEAEAIAVRIARALDEPLIVNECIVRVSVSMGIAHSPGRSAPCEDVLRAASRALSLAKEAGGRGWRTFDPSMLETGAELRQDLAIGLARNEIVPYYQPIIDLDSGTLIGLEVLARWHHPRLGLLLPEQFIKTLEAERVLKGLTTALLQQVAEDAASWPDDLVFSFNIAACQIRELATYVLMQSKDQAAFLAPHRIEVEIGEAGLIDDMEATRQLVLLLQERGARVALDNFGGERANLRHICGIPFDRLKISREFVRDVLHDTRAAICVQSIATIGRQLGISVTAGGIASQEIAKRVHELGCSFAQGSFYGMPGPAAEVDGMIARVQDLLSEPLHPRH
jgi:diguanylate cyclase (GGDEF)-like protein